MRTFLVRYQVLGGHIHCRVFSAKHPLGTFAKIGELVMDEEDWDSFWNQIGRGWQLLPENVDPAVVQAADIPTVDV